MAGLRWTTTATGPSSTAGYPIYAPAPFNIFDTDHTGAAANTGQLQEHDQDELLSGAGGGERRQGPRGQACAIRLSVQTWGGFANSYQLGNQSGNQYTNYDAIHEWNA